MSILGDKAWDKKHTLVDLALGNVEDYLEIIQDGKPKEERKWCYLKETIIRDMRDEKYWSVSFITRHEEGIQEVFDPIQVIPKEVISIKWEPVIEK